MKFLSRLMQRPGNEILDNPGPIRYPTERCEVPAIRRNPSDDMSVLLDEGSA